jgi:glycosyltransferase involved in cell wall biosynthesis
MKILILHFRSAPRGAGSRDTGPDVTDSAGTDGVSLEIMKRQALLASMGHEVAISSAYDWADLPIPALEFDREDVAVMMRNLFGSAITGLVEEANLERSFGEAVGELRRDLEKAIRTFGPDLVFVHNVLCLPIHPVATVCLTELLRDLRLPCVAIHHDVLSEGAYKFAPSCDFARSLLLRYFPPTMRELSHWTINTRNQKALEARGIQAGVIYDSMDFEDRLDAAEHARLRAELRARHGVDSCDVVLFVGARIVPNKQIELAGHLTAALQRRRREMVGRMLYNGEVFSEESRVILVLAGRPERSFAEYQDSLFALLDSLKVDWIYVGDDVRPRRVPEEGLYALYPDMYSMADFVLYPSGWEGFGNQLLEAFAAGLPVAVFEYPVFTEDIAPKGVRVVSLGRSVLQERDRAGLVRVAQDVLSRASQEMMTLLTDQKQYSDIVDHNISVGRGFFSFDVLRAHLADAITWAQRSMGVEHDG